MPSQDNSYLSSVFYGFLVGLFVGLLFMPAVYTGTTESWRDELLSQGLYEWRIDAKTGEREFVPVKSGTEGE
jgi:hypothetical protein